MKAQDVLASSSFGQRTAEEERENLRAYFVETEQWRQVFKGEVDIVYGPKGSGKSAIYNLISQSKDELFDRSIIVVPGENPQGTPAFRDLKEDPPHDESEFVNLWKLYILALCGRAIKDYGITGPKCTELLAVLEETDLIPSSFSLAKVLRYALDYVRRIRLPQSLETGVSLDPSTGVPTTFTGRIVFQEPSAAAAKRGIVSADELFATASAALAEAGYTVWIVLDRLDVAFADKEDLEVSALRALFKFYLDTKSHRNIATKIFLRSDIWSSITRSGFREASHIERSLSIKWTAEDLTNLVVRRAASNEAICEFYGVTRDQILATYESQEAFLSRMWPDQVDTGPNKPKSFKWILGRTRDASQATAPANLFIFLTNCETSKSIEWNAVTLILLERSYSSKQLSRRRCQSSQR